MNKILTCSLLLSASLLALPGCVVVVDDDGHHEPLPNHSPYVLEGDDLTWWWCADSPADGDYFWEFQATVDDLDGLGDIESVDVYIYRAERDELVDAYGLLDEGGGVYGGLVWEADSYLFCSDPVDVLFEVVDVHGDVGTLWDLYYD